MAATEANAVPKWGNRGKSAYAFALMQGLKMPLSAKVKPTWLEHAQHPIQETFAMQALDFAPLGPYSRGTFVPPQLWF